MAEALDAETVLSLGGRDRSESRRTVLSLAFLAAISIPLLFYGLGGPALIDPDEPYYAVPAAEMLRTHTWSIPVFRGQPWLDKPPMFYWAVAGAYRAFGVSEAASRLPSALAALLCALAVFALVPRRKNGDEVPFASACILTSSVGFALLARAAITDMTLTLFLTAGMLCVARYLGCGRARFAAWAGASFGLAALTKGPVGILVPAVALVAYGIAARRADLLRPAALAAALIAFLATAGPWYGFAAVTHPDLLFGSFLQGGNVGRFLQPERASFPLFYVGVFLVGFLPWSGALPAALIASCRRAGWHAETGAGMPVGGLFALCWFAGVVAPFAVSASKLATYVLPAFPPAAILLAAYWTHAFDPRARRTYGPVVAWGIGAVVSAVVLSALAVASHEPRWSAAAPGILATGSALLLGSILAFPAIRRENWYGILSIHSATAMATVLLLWMRVLPSLESLQSNCLLARTLQAERMSDEVIGAFDVRDVSLDYYLSGAMLRLEDRDRLVRAVVERPGKLWIVRTRDLAVLRSEPRFRLEPAVMGPNRCAVRLTPVGVPHGEAS